MEVLSSNQLEHNDYRYIRQVRFLKGLSQQDMAKFMSISPSVLCRVEGGQIKFTSYYKDRFIEVCKKLHVTDSELDSITQLLLQRS